MTVAEAFSPVDWHPASGGRWVAVIAPVAAYDPRPLVDQVVTLNGVAYLVQGIDNTVLNDPTGRTFGLLVGEPMGGAQ